MTSSLGVASYSLWSREPETADVDQVFLVPRVLVSCRQYYEDRCKCHHGTHHWRTLQLQRHVKRCVRSYNGMWSLRGRLVLFVLLAVMFHCLASADSAQQQPASPSRLGTCRVLINHTIIDLSRLHQAIASVRYQLILSVIWWRLHYRSSTYYEY